MLLNQGSHGSEKVQKFPLSAEKVQKIGFSTEKVQNFYFSTENVQKFQNFVVSVQKKYRNFKILWFQNNKFQCFQSNFGSADACAWSFVWACPANTSCRLPMHLQCMQAEAQFGYRKNIYSFSLDMNFVMPWLTPVVQYQTIVQPLLGHRRRM